MKPALAVMFLALLYEVWVCKGIGVNWGTMASHKLPPTTVVQMLRDNNIGNVKLFDADSSTLSALEGSGIRVMVAIPNDQLASMTNYDSAKKWVARNVTHYLTNGDVDIRYVAVGNEPFLASYNGSFDNLTFPALQNIQNALNEAGLGAKVKATVPLNADVYQSPATNPVPSAGRFRTDVDGVMNQIVEFLNKNDAPFTVNIYPFLSLFLNKDFPIEFAFFDGTSSPLVDNGSEYTNVFDANFDTLVSALNRVGLENMPIIIGEIGWPSEGDVNANFTFAERFYDGLLKRMATKQGSPLRPNQTIETYLFSLFDEDRKSIAPGSFERHWGIFRYDGQPKYLIDLSDEGIGKKLPVGAKYVEYLPRRWCVLDTDAILDPNMVEANVNYACTNSDCTALGLGSTCNGMDEEGKASYAFNMYYQVENQNDESCFFQGLAMVTTRNASRGRCNFILQIATSPSLNLFPWFYIFVLHMFLAAMH